MKGESAFSYYKPYKHKPYTTNHTRHHLITATFAVATSAAATATTTTATATATATEK